MARKKGSPKTGGRVSGTPNKKTEELFEKCARLGCDPFEALLHLVSHKEPYIQLGALKEVCKYLYPQRKAIVHSGEITNPYLQKSIDELEELVKEKLGS